MTRFDGGGNGERKNINVFFLGKKGRGTLLIPILPLPRKIYICFSPRLRTVAAVLARRVTGARRGNAVGRFWDAPAYSRLLTWGREFAAVRGYCARNRLEAIGFLTTADRALPLDLALAAGNARKRAGPHKAVGKVG